MGGDKVDYPFPVATPTADITIFKCLVNSVLSTNNAKFVTADIRDFYLNTPMSRYEYIKLLINIIPEEIIQQYNLHLLFTTMITYMWKSKKGCMACHRRATLQITS